MPSATPSRLLTGLPQHRSEVEAPPHQIVVSPSRDLDRPIVELRESQYWLFDIEEVVQGEAGQGSRQNIVLHLQPLDVLHLTEAVLLDLKQDSSDSLTANDAVRYLLKVELKRGEGVFTYSTLCIGCAKLGSLDQIIKAGKANDLLKKDFKNGMHCLIVPAKKLHFMEEEALKLYF